jgi:hypothetical protein
VVEHHADFAVPVLRRLRVETARARPTGDGTVAGDVLALGWWVDPEAGAGGEQPTGALSLVADESLPRPVWVAQGDLTGFRLED